MSLASAENWHTSNAEDAFFLGRLSVVGIARPNAPHLRRPSVSIPLEDIGSDHIQSEIDRLVGAAENLARIPDCNFIGLAHTQLKTTLETPKPLDLVLVPMNDLPEAPVETNIRGFAFRALINTNWRTTASSSLGSYREGCFSSWQVVTISQRPSGTELLSATTREGFSIKEPREVTNITEAVTLQHEGGHLKGERVADNSNLPRLWVSRKDLADFRALPPAEAAVQWPHRVSQEQWQTLSTDQNYNFLPTMELQEAYLQGQEAQRELQSR